MAVNFYHSLSYIAGRDREGAEGSNRKRKWGRCSRRIWTVVHLSMWRVQLKCFRKSDSKRFAALSRTDSWTVLAVSFEGAAFITRTFSASVPLIPATWSRNKDRSERTAVDQFRGGQAFLEAARPSASGRALCVQSSELSRNLGVCRTNYRASHPAGPFLQFHSPDKSC
jgi:hypothetical protein